MRNGSGCAQCPVTKCDAIYRSSRCASYRDKANVSFDPKTNRDVMRAMSDEQLAKELSQTFCHGIGEKEILEWLQKTIAE